MHRAVHAAYPVERISIEYGFFLFPVSGQTTDIASRMSDLAGHQKDRISGHTGYPCSFLF